MDASWKKLDRDQEFCDVSDYARPVALLVTRFLVNTPVSSIQVTFLFLLAGLLAAAFLCLGVYGGAVIAALFIQLKNMLDAVDGSLARAKNTQSPVGRYLDSIFDFIVNVALYSAIAIYLAKTGTPVWLPFLSGLAFVSALLQCSLFNYYSVAYRRLQTGSDMSRLDESQEIEETQNTGHKDTKENDVLRLLQKTYLIIYGWQDKLIYSLDGFKKVVDPLAHSKTDAALLGKCYLDKQFMKWVSFLGLGTQLLLMTFFALTNYLEIYLWTIVILGNMLFGFLIRWTHRQQQA